MLKVVIAASISSFFFGLFGIDWDKVDQKITNEFPDISYISTDELDQRIGSGRESPLIIDVREPEEFQVSHLENAINIETSTEVARQVPDKDAEIIVYCSVGYRSAGVAAQLQAMGYNNVRNLRHSVFEWANKGYPLQNAAGQTSKAHPFNQAWGKLLDSALHQYEPDQPR